MVTIGYPVTQNIKKCYLLHGCEATYLSSQVCEFRWVKVMEKNALHRWFLLADQIHRAVAGKSPRKSGCKCTCNECCCFFFSFSCGIFNIKLGNVWNLLGSGLFWLHFGMCWQGLGSLVLRVVIYGNSRYKLFSISCWKNSSMNLAIQLQMCACHLDLASIWFYLGWGIPKKNQNHGY